MQQRYYEWFRRTYRMQDAMRREAGETVSMKYRRMVCELARIYLVQGDVRQVNELAAQFYRKIAGAWDENVDWDVAVMFAEISAVNRYLGSEPEWQKSCLRQLEKMVPDGRRKKGPAGEFSALIEVIRFLFMLSCGEHGREAELLLEDIRKECSSRVNLGVLHADVLFRLLEMRLYIEKEMYQEAEASLDAALFLLNTVAGSRNYPPRLRLLLYRRKMTLLEKQNKLYAALQAHKDYTALYAHLSRERERAYTAFLQDLYDVKEQERNILKLRMKNRRLSEQANVDALTGLGNRKALMRTSFQMLGKTAEGPVSLACIMADLDFFKAYNDHYGHLQGDSILSSVGQVLRDFRKKGWQVFRYGGEEFLLLRRDADEADAKKAAENILSSLRHRAIPHKMSTVDEYVTMSMGVASSRCHLSEDIRRLIREADEALYSAKARGRACCVCFSEMEARA